MLADISLGDVLWSTIVLFFMIMVLMAFFMIVGDLFRDPDMGGVAKAIWLIVLVFFPFVTMFVYLIVRGGGMAERSMRRAQSQQAQMDAYVKSVALSSGSAADEIARAKGLFDSGTITEQEFAVLKQKALG